MTLKELDHSIKAPKKSNVKLFVLPNEFGCNFLRVGSALGIAQEVLNTANTGWVKKQIEECKLLGPLSKIEECFKYII